MNDKKQLFLSNQGIEKIEGFVSDNLQVYKYKDFMTAFYNPNKFDQNTRQNNCSYKLCSKAIKSARFQIKTGESIAVKVELRANQTESGRRRVLNLKTKDFCFE